MVRGQRDRLAAGRVPAARVSTRSISLRAPFRLDLTVSVLRRSPANPVDILGPDGQYRRWLDYSGRSAILRVGQPAADRLIIQVSADPRDHRGLLFLARRMLGLDVDLARFDRSISRIRSLAPLAGRMRGVRPPRYPSLWEAAVNAIVFQQVSLASATSIAGRLIRQLGDPIECDGLRLYRFPGLATFRAASDSTLRAAGLSGAKLATLRRVADAIATGGLDQRRLERRSSEEVAAQLCRITGIGPWTAAVILLRGLGRLDVFPAADTSVARNLALVGGSTPIDPDRILRRLGPDRGMLYYHLLLARLEARGDLGRPSGS